MNKERTILRVVLICIVISAALHWRDIKNGFVDGIKDGVEHVDSK